MATERALQKIMKEFFRMENDKHILGAGEENEALQGCLDKKRTRKH